MALCRELSPLPVTCVHDVYSESPLNTYTRIIWTILRVPLVSVLTWFHCIGFGSDWLNRVFTCTCMLFCWSHSLLHKLFEWVLFSHLALHSTPTRDILRFDPKNAIVMTQLYRDPGSTLDYSGTLLIRPPSWKFGRINGVVVLTG